MPALTCRDRKRYIAAPPRCLHAPRSCLVRAVAWFPFVRPYRGRASQPPPSSGCGPVVSYLPLDASKIDQFTQPAGPARRSAALAALFSPKPDLPMSARLRFRMGRVSLGAPWGLSAEGGDGPQPLNAWRGSSWMYADVEAVCRLNHARSSGLCLYKHLSPRQDNPRAFRGWRSTGEGGSR